MENIVNSLFSDFNFLALAFVVYNVVKTEQLDYTAIVGFESGIGNNAIVLHQLLCSAIGVYAYDGKCEGANYYLCESYQSAGLAYMRQGLEDVQPVQGREVVMWLYRGDAPLVPFYELVLLIHF